jgi:hypothetical protein
MRYVIVGLFAVIALSLSGPAQAYCCWNKAICIAVCGSACCGSDLKIATPVDPAGLKKFSVADLTRAQNEARREAANSDFLKLLSAEIKGR